MHVIEMCNNERKKIPRIDWCSLIFHHFDYKHGIILRNIDFTFVLIGSFVRIFFFCIAKNGRRRWRWKIQSLRNSQLLPMIMMNDSIECLTLVVSSFNFGIFSQWAHVSRWDYKHMLMRQILFFPPIPSWQILG